jgi:anti-sigma regulatory factor (Ser/Thr protein kinase)
VSRIVLAVGAAIDRPAVRSALAERGYALSVARPAEALVEWAPEARPSCVVVGPGPGDEYAARLCRHIKLSERLNAIPAVVLREGGAPAVPADAVRIEPDAYLPACASAARVAGAVEAAGRRARRRAGDGARFHVELVMGSDLGLLGELADLLEPIHWNSALGRRAAARLKYATLEMAVNAVEWGNRWDLEKCVRVTITVYQDRLRTVIRDEGDGFDLACLPRNGVPDDIVEQMMARVRNGVRLGGYGIQVCREFVDEVRYNARGNEVTLVKYLREAKRGPSRAGAE